MKISTNKFVALSYDLIVGEGDDRELMERATEQKPLEFIFGTNSMLEAFERNVEGLKEGDTFDFTITPDETADVYGEYEEERIVDLPRHIFEQDGKLSEEVYEGNVIPMMNTNGERLQGAVVLVKDDTVTIDFNHPLASENLNFKGTILTVRESTPEEIAALFAPQGCGCSSCGCGEGEKDGCECGPGCECN